MSKQDLIKQLEETESKLTELREELKKTGIKEENARLKKALYVAQHHINQHLEWLKVNSEHPKGETLTLTRQEVSVVISNLDIVSNQIKAILNESEGA